MKRKSEPGRSSTEPSVDKLLQKNIKVQGIIYIDAPIESNKNSTILQIKSQNKVMYHCYKRFKTFSYSFDHVYQQNESSQFYSDNFNQFNAADAIQNRLNYMMFCSGVGIKTKKQILTTQILFYEQLSAIYERLIKDKQYIWKLNFVAITEDFVYDLISQNKTTQIRQFINNKTPHISDINLTDCSQISPQTNYQILQIIKQSMMKKSKLSNKSYYAIFGQINSNQAQDKQLLLFVDSTKNMGIEDKNWDNNSCLVLNKCILGLQNKMQKNLETYTPFRDAKITRIMKPFLMSDSRVDSVGFVNYNEEDSLLSTLSLIKNLSRLRIPITKKSKFKFTQIKQPIKTIGNQQLNPEFTPQKNSINLDKNQNFRKTLKQNKQQQKSDGNLIQKIRKNAQNQLETTTKISNIRLKLKLLIKKRQLDSFALNLNEQKKLTQGEIQQLDYLRKKQQEANQQAHSLQKSRIQFLNKSISKVEKLKMLKQYYTVSVANQKIEIQQFKKNQSFLTKFYNQKLAQVNQSLKKSPHQLINQDLFESNKQTVNLKHKTQESGDIYDKQKLPIISTKQSKRAAYIKQKIKKGRVQYYDFLDKNVSQYKSYSVPIKKQ